MKKVNIDFYPDNIEKLLSGIKISTLRSKSQAKKIGLEKNETGIFVVEGIEFEVFCHGEISVSDAGGRDVVWKNEGFSEQSPPRFKQTVDFLNGNDKLFYYIFKKMP